MKGKFRSCFALIVFTLFLGGIQAQTIITEWTFEESPLLPNDINPSPTFGAGSASIVGSMTTLSRGTGSSTGCAQTSGTGSWAIGSASPGTNESSGAQFMVATTGYSGIRLTYDQRMSNTSTRTERIQYTLDGTTWVNFDVNATNSTITCNGSYDNGRFDRGNTLGQNMSDSWSRKTVDFSSISGASNNPDFGVRIVAAHFETTGQFRQANNSLNVATGGTWRFDNVRFSANAASVSIASANNYVVYNENAGVVQIPVTVSNANPSAIDLTFGLAVYSTATETSDFTWTSTLSIPAATNGVFNLPLTIIDDNNSERAETIIVKIVSGTNASISSTNYYQIIYVKDNDYVAPTPENDLQLSLLTSYSNGTSGSNSAEIVAFDPSTDRLYIANSIGAKLDIVDFSDPSAPTPVSSVNVTPYGNINSVTVHNGIVAMAIENAVPQENGSVVFLDANGTFLSQVTVGAMPDMITFNKDFTKILTANEGEPGASYSNDPLNNTSLSVDPEGSISVVDLTPGITSLTNANVTTISLSQFNGQEAALRAQGIRIFSSSATVAQDMEPEYITISDDNTRAYVALQENNALLIIDLSNNSIVSLVPLGFSDYSNGNGMDASDQTTGHVLITSLPVKGAYMPDAMTYATIGGQGYVFSANEGDSREFGAVTDAARISTLTLDAVNFPDQAIVKNNRFAGRLNGLKYSGDTDSDGDLDEIHVMGGRSFSIWNATTGALVFDSKDLIEQITANHPVFSAIFNASNSTGTPSFKNRSDDKGPEPEGVAYALIDGKNYLFVSLERIGGAMIFNVDNPSQPVYQGYYNNRSTSVSGPDLGAEGMIYISSQDSPNGNDLLILANEVSSTLSVYQVNTCVELAGAEITAASTTLCEGESTSLTVQGASGSNYQWYYNNQMISGETSTSLIADQSGEYEVFVQNSLLACSDTSTKVMLTVNPLPSISGSASQNTICAGTQVTLNGNGGDTYTWNNGVLNNIAFAPIATTTYTVTGTASNGCTNTGTVLVTVNPLPTITALASQTTVCAGTQITLNGNGGVSYSWNNGVTNGVAFTPTANTTYTVTGTGLNGCTKNATVAIVVNSLPTITAVASETTVCAGTPVTLNGNGGNSYSWDNGVIDGMAFVPAVTGTYTVTGTNSSGCINTANVGVTVNPNPTISVTASDEEVCAGSQVTLSGNGAITYTWNNGVMDGIAFVPGVSSNYTVTGIDINGCENSTSVYVTVHEIPNVVANVTDNEICEGQNVVFYGSGAQSYTWNNSIVNGISAVLSSSGTFEVIGIDGNGCTNSDEVEVIVNATPSISLGVDTTICASNAPLELGVDETFADYNWNNGASTSTIQVNQTGSYSLTVTAANGCTDSDEILVIIDPCLGVEEQSNSINIYPNPTNGSVIMNFGKEISKGQIKLFDAQGRLVLEDEINGENHSLEISSFASGIYTVVLVDGQAIMQARIIKE